MTKKQDTSAEEIKAESGVEKEIEEKVESAAEQVEAAAAAADAEVNDSDPDLKAEVERLKQELIAANAKAEENWEHFVRTKADLDNLERRSKKDIENAHKYAGEKLLEAMIPVIDSLEMGALAAQQESADISKIQEGMELTLKMFSDTLSKFEVKKLDPTGNPFNPEFHQAMSIQESEEHAANTVLSVMQKGYLLNERLIRPALVVVSKPPKNSKSSDEDAKAEDDQAQKPDADASSDSIGKTIDEKA